MASPHPNQKPEPVEFSGWGAAGGATLGVVIGFFAGHWIIWTLTLGSLAWIVGGLIDRSRR